MKFYEADLAAAVRALGGEDVAVLGPLKAEGGDKQSFALMFSLHGSRKRMAVYGPSGRESDMLRGLLKWASEAA